MLTKQVLSYLAKRLARIGEPECNAAFALVAHALTEFDEISRNIDAELKLFHRVWGHVSRALDVNEFPAQYRDELEALEAEMAGHVLTIRLATGQLVAKVPVEVPPVREGRGGRVAALLRRFT